MKKELQPIIEVNSTNETDNNLSSYEVVGVQLQQINKKLNTAKQIRKHIPQVSDVNAKVTKYGFKTQEQEDAAIKQIVTDANNQDLVKPKNHSLRQQFLNGTLPQSKRNGKALEGLRDDGYNAEIVFTLKDGNVNKSLAPKKAGNDEFLQTSANAKYYSDGQKSKFRGVDFGYKEASVCFRQGTDTFVHDGNDGNGKGGDYISGHTGHLYRDKAKMLKNESGITSGSVSNVAASNVSNKGKNTYHGIRHSEVIDGNDNLKPPIEGLKGSVKSHISQAYNKDKIEKALNKTQSPIFTSQGFNTKTEAQDFESNMALNRDKQKICFATLDLDGRGRKIDSIKHLNDELNTRGISSVRYNSPISLEYVQRSIRDANNTTNIEGLGKIAQRRAPVIKTK